MALPSKVTLVVFLGPACFAAFLATEGGVDVELFEASADLDALHEVPETIGVGNVVAHAQAEEVFAAGADENLLLGGVLAKSMELLQNEGFEHERWVKRGGLPPLF